MLDQSRVKWSVNLVGLWAAVMASAVSVSHAAAEVDLSSPAIVCSTQASALEQMAARELWRYLARVSGKPGTMATDNAVGSDRATIVLLDVAGNNRLAAEIESGRKSRSTEPRSAKMVFDGR